MSDDEVQARPSQQVEFVAAGAFTCRCKRADRPVTDGSCVGNYYGHIRIGHHRFAIVQWDDVIPTDLVEISRIEVERVVEQREWVSLLAEVQGVSSLAGEEPENGD